MMAAPIKFIFFLFDYIICFHEVAHFACSLMRLKFENYMVSHSIRFRSSRRKKTNDREKAEGTWLFKKNKGIKTKPWKRKTREIWMKNKIQKRLNNLQTNYLIAKNYQIWFEHIKNPLWTVFFFKPWSETVSFTKFARMAKCFLLSFPSHRAESKTKKRKSRRSCWHLNSQAIQMMKLVESPHKSNQFLIFECGIDSVEKRRI